MRTRWLRYAGLALVGIVVGVGLVVVGRLTAGTSAARSAGYSAGQQAGYSDGLREGRSEGVQEGRSLQVPVSLPPGEQDAARAAFNAGYAAGANDVFGGWDGGWDTGTPYVVMVTGSGGGGITYRIKSRTLMRPGVSYHLCPGSTTLCD